MNCEHQATDPAPNGYRCRDCGEVFVLLKRDEADRIGADAYANEYD